jgi:hypothetical protein
MWPGLRRLNGDEGMLAVVARERVIEGRARDWEEVKKV